MIIFDKGNKILKSVEFKREPAALIYQLKHAETVPDRADAAKALGEVKGNADAVAALGEAARSDAFLGRARGSVCERSEKSATPRRKSKSKMR